MVFKNNGPGGCCCEPPIDTGDDPCLCFELPDILPISYEARSSTAHPTLVNNGLGGAVWVDNWVSHPTIIPTQTDTVRYFEDNMNKMSNFVWEHNYTDPLFMDSFDFKVECESFSLSRDIALFVNNTQIVQRPFNNWPGAFESRPLYMYASDFLVFVTAGQNRNYVPTHLDPPDSDCNPPAYQRGMCCPPIVEFNLSMAGRTYIFYALYDDDISGWEIDIVSTDNVGLTLWPAWNAVEELIDPTASLQQPTMQLNIRLTCTGRVTVSMGQTQNYHGGAPPSPACGPLGCRLGYSSIPGTRTINLGGFPCIIDPIPSLQFPTERIAPQLPEHHDPAGTATLTFQFIS